MSKLPKEILNYFATFTETRFNFRRLINYKWTNDELTLDLSFFPEFQQTLLKKIESGDLSSLSIKPKEYTIVISKDCLLLEIKKLLQGNFNAVYLEKCLQSEFIQVAEQNKMFVVGGDGELQLAQESEGEQELLNHQKALAQKEGIRVYNLAFRRQFEKTLNLLQDKIVEQTKVELNIEHAPASIFGVVNYVTQHFGKLKIMSHNFTDSEQYLSDVLAYFSGSIDDIDIYDLYYNFHKYAEFVRLGTLYVFFHMLEKGNEAYPLYFIEAEFRVSNAEVVLSFPRNLMLLNTPAINYFKFSSVLTVPRASSFATTKAHLGAMEAFIQTQYGFQNPFILQPNFACITHENQIFPQIKNRIGLQIVTNEDKKLLDYSELMTRMELGGLSKFAEFIDQYVKGKVPNHQEEIDRTFLEKYALKDPARYVSDSPIPVNNAQKRILLALANDKNNIIVVDGPPGTGKSHAIAALTYWANEHNKSVVITSHKQEALDVIDRMLTDKYKSLHPIAKPSIVRMDKETGSANNLLNTLQSSVLGAASQRALGYNEAAIESDEKKLSVKLTTAIEKIVEHHGYYEKVIRKTIEFDHLESELAKDATLAGITSAIPAPDQAIDFATITDFIASGFLPKLSNTSLEEYAYLIDQKNNIPDFLDACERLNQITEDARQIETTLTEIPTNFLALLSELKKHFKHNIKISEISTKHTTTGLLQKVFGKAPKKQDLESLLQQLKSLQFISLVKEFARILNIEKEKVTIDNLSSGVDKVKFALSMRPHQALLASYRALPGNQDKDISDVYEKFRNYSEASDLVNDNVYQALNSLFKNYGVLLNPLGISENSLDTLAKLVGHDEQIKNIWQWIQLHYFLSEKAKALAIDPQDFQTYFKLKQKHIEHLNDNRLKNLNNHLGDMARMQVSYEGGKRFTVEEAKVLLNCISCIIAEPGTISKHFPMEEGLIDVLIIDEASQVSIADSISLILRARQVVIFGDEYQYGAVSATNVSSRYSASYFSEIITAFADDYNAKVSEAAKKELVDEVSKTVMEDEEQSDTLYKPADGTVLWLKTFNIRTSTLTFAKAIANYTASLKEHYRSFPELISIPMISFTKKRRWN